MGKRKDAVDSDEEEALATPSESEEKKPRKAAKKPTKLIVAAKKPQLESDDEEEEEAEERPPKRKKVEKPSSSKKSSSKDANVDTGALLVDASGDKYIDLGKKRRATVRSFKGTTYLDIREYYDAGGEERPGKKGISLSTEQWSALKENAEIIDVMFSKSKK